MPETFRWKQVCVNFNQNRTRHSFVKHELCCVRGEAAGGDESDFGEDGDVDGCHHRNAACSCVYNDTLPARWHTSSWKAGSQITCAAKHDSIKEGYVRVPSQTRNQKLKQLQRERKGNEQQGRAFYQDQADLQNQIRDLQQQLDAKERDYTSANIMIEELEGRLSHEVEDRDRENTNAKSKVADLMRMIEALPPPGYENKTLVEQLQIFATELEMVVGADDDDDVDVENQSTSPSHVNIVFPSRIKKVF